MDVIVSSVVDVSHVFVQQPTHPTFTCLEQLNYCMNTCYGQDGIVPQLPRPIEGWLEVPDLLVFDCNIPKTCMQGILLNAIFRVSTRS